MRAMIGQFISTSSKFNSMFLLLDSVQRSSILINMSQALTAFVVPIACYGIVIFQFNQRLSWEIELKK